MPKYSIMMPCFNAAKTLPLALASVRAQTVEDWECICLDDGSSDETFDILQKAAAQDRRFVALQFPENRGRGAARQAILEAATGEYFAPLDADDWMFPNRIEHACSWLDRSPEIEAVSGGMVIFDSDLNPLSQQMPSLGSGAPWIGILDSPGSLGFAFNSSTIRTRLAKEHGFDPKLLRSQDTDFLRRALMGRRYAIAPEPVYALGSETITVERTLRGYRYRTIAQLKHWREKPVGVARETLLTAAKAGVLSAAKAVGQERRILDNRFPPLTSSGRATFEAAREVVVAEMKANPIA